MGFDVSEFCDPDEIDLELEEKKRKFLEEFKNFALKGNVMNLAVGVIIGAAFSDLVTSLTTNLIQPLIACLGAREMQGRIQLFGTENYLNYGAFISAVINFIIMAFVVFLLVKAVNGVMSLGKKKEEEKKPTTKICPYCKSTIDVEAVKCPCCTSDL